MDSIAYNIDCMDFMHSLPDKAFDLAVVDPPYGLPKDSTHGRGKLKDRCLNRGGLERWDVRPGKEYFDELERVSRNRIIWGGNYFPLPPTRCVVCWDKQQVWENFSQCEIAWTSFDWPAKHVTIPNRGGQGDKNKFHPTQKPVELYEYILRTFAKPGDRILDTHLGSGSSRIAAYRLGFDFVGCELDREYYEKQEERFRRECLGETVAPDGKTYKQLEIF